MPLIVDKEAVRMEILMAFERCIEKKPMTKITLRDIAGRPGCRIPSSCTILKAGTIWS